MRQHYSSIDHLSRAVALSVLKKIEGYQDIGQPSALNISTHRLDEAIRFAYGEVRVNKR